MSNENTLQKSYNLKEDNEEKELSFALQTIQQKSLATLVVNLKMSSANNIRIQNKNPLNNTQTNSKVFFFSQSRELTAYHTVTLICSLISNLFCLQQNTPFCCRL